MRRGNELPGIDPSLVKLARRRKPWTQDELAADLTARGWTITRGGIAKVETSRRNVSVGEALTLAESLGQSLYWLVYGDDS